MIRTNRAHLYVTAQTHSGMSGKNNEDNFAVSAYVISSNNPTPAVFAIVSDGIGGHKAGEVASEMAVDLISAEVEKREKGHPLAVFEHSFYKTSLAISRKANENTLHKGMGATAACAWIIGQQLYIAYAGDSRIYLISRQKIRQLSHDHTWVQEAIDKGIINPTAGINNHPNLHVIRRYLGSDLPPQPDLRLYLEPGESDKRAKANQGLTLAPGDVILLCTDGLSDLISDREISGVLFGRTLTDAAKTLIDMANFRGGHDNITVVMLGVPWNPNKTDPGWKPG